ncbi:MAG: hypothetical protein WEA77_07905 [Hyphomonas sp.]|uniref:hypothetical protein n=1 Tax=Hyphomonas sp. TaxID=87 RepID=UPI0034A089E4
MKRIGWILLCGLFLAQPGQALQEPPASPEPDARRSEFSNELDAFVRQAMNEGLLDPIGTEKLSAGPKSIVPEAAEKDVEDPPTEGVAAGLTDCAAPYPLDFSEFRSLRRYSDIYAYREETVAEGEVQEIHAGARLAKAYIALDLAAEAAMTIKTGRDQQTTALQNLVMLLEGRGPAPADYFKELEGCYRQAGIWRALSLVSKKDPAGPALLEAHMAAFRELPPLLRERAAMLAIPALDAMNQRPTAKLLIASFTSDEIASSSQLQFSEALIRLGEGDPDAERLISRYLVQSRFQEAALMALVRNKRSVNGALREILLDEMITRIELARKDADIRVKLGFVLGALSETASYLPMMRLAELPSMQSDEARSTLTRHLVTSLQGDLDGDNSLRTLAAVEAMIKDQGILDAAPERAELFESATLVAVRLGFASLADALAVKAKGGEAAAEQRALLAYRQKNYQEIYDLARQHSSSQRVNLIAALAAIDTKDRTGIATFEGRLKLEPETILTLIEQDATTSHWLVSDRVYQAARKLGSDDHKLRVERVMRLKRLPADPVASTRVAMSTISGKLNSSRESLALLSAEAP